VVLQVATKQSIQEKQNETFKVVLGGIVSLWFASAIKDHASCQVNFQLQPHSALCLAVMVNKSVASSRGIAVQLGRFGLGLFEMAEAPIVVEYGMRALQDAGFVRLDATGKKEFLIAQDARNYGLEGVNWTLTAAGAKRGDLGFGANSNGKTCGFTLVPTGPSSLGPSLTTTNAYWRSQPALRAGAILVLSTYIFCSSPKVSSLVLTFPNFVLPSI